MDTYDFINKLRNDKYFTIKQLTHIETINIYVDDLNVYKVMLAVYPNELKKARKLGLKQQYIIYEENFGKIKQPKFESQQGGKTYTDISHGKYLLTYNPHNRDVNVWDGENLELM